MHIAKRYERKRNHKDKTITPNPPSKEAFSEELETDLLGLIGDMETDLSFADEAVHEGDRPGLLGRLQSVVLEANEAIHLLKRDVRRSASAPPQPPLDRHTL